jgi:tRNA (mo5U34)-methyltransferase
MLNKWTEYRLPEDMQGKTFLDVGCWEGERCVEALQRGARRSVGIDLCTSETLRRNVEEHGFEFVQMDIFSEKFWELEDFDVVLCSGVLYHVENVLSLLFRLRKTARELLVLETAATRLYDDESIMVFYPATGAERWPSRWWTPNARCLTDMLLTCGFEDVREVYRRDVDERLCRICVQARPGGFVPHDKFAPRRQQFMSLYGGDRRKGKSG